MAAFDWSVVGKTGDVPSGTLSLDTTDKKLTGATSGGTVVITMKARGSDKKYMGQVNLADFTVGKQEYPLTIDTKYSTPAGALANRINALRIDVDSLADGIFSTASLTSAMAGNLTVTKINTVNDITSTTGGTGVTSTVLDTSSANQGMRVITVNNGVASAITGNDSTVIAAIQTAFRAREVVVIQQFRSNDSALKLRIQIPADSNKKYNAYDEILYLITN